MDSPSPGQMRARAITTDVLRVFSNEANNEAAQQALLTQLAAEAVVRGDLSTGARIVSQTIAASVMKWMSDNSTPRAAPPAAPAVDFSRVYFGGSAVGADGWLDTNLKIYQGGTKSPTMARAMLTRMGGGKVPTQNMNITHYSPDNVFRVAEGNHRLLACMMLGHAVFPAECIDWREAPPVEASLNRALLCLEHVAGAEATGFPIDGNIDQIFWLAAAYGTADGAGKQPELWRFVQADLASQRGPVPAGCHAPLPDDLSLLTDYVTTYRAATAGLRKESWLERLLGRWPGFAAPEPVLTVRQEQIQQRFVAWRAR